MLMARSAPGGERAKGRRAAAFTEAGGGRLPCRAHLMAAEKPVYAPGLPRFERAPHFCCPGRLIHVPNLPASARNWG